MAFSAAGEGGKKAFYEGATGKAIAAAVAAEGGLLTEADLAAHHSDFDTAMSVEYHGVEVQKENERVLCSTFIDIHLWSFLTRKVRDKHTENSRPSPFFCSFGSALRVARVLPP
eukprot:COSAG06_NODE_948_length_11359_cov_6.236146_14_plen_114_part_00